MTRLDERPEMLSINTAPITATITVPAGPATYLNSRAAHDARNAWAHAQRPGSAWGFSVTVNGETVASAGDFATHGEAVAAMYAATPALFTTVTSIAADTTTWNVTGATPARPGYGKGSDGIIVGTAEVTLIEATHDADCSPAYLCEACIDAIIEASDDDTETVAEQLTDAAAARQQARRVSDIRTNSYGDAFIAGDRAAWSATQAEHTGTILRFESGDIAVIETGAFAPVVYIELDSLYPAS